MLEDRICDLVSEYENEWIELRRAIHKNPEIAMNEFQTAKLIATELKKCKGIEVYEEMAGGTGVVGILRGGKEGKCILLRSDIDALEIEEKTDVTFKSGNQYMHACGHDAHAAWLVGAAKILSEMKDEVPGIVKFVFQPGEERGAGAKELIEQDGVLTNPTVDCAFSAHTWPTIPVGKIGIAREYAFGCPGIFQVKILGKGGHGSTPHLSTNPILVASQICTMFSQIISDKIDGTEPRVISVCSFQAGSSKGMNIIPDSCVFGGTVRAVKMDILKKIEEEMSKIIKKCCNLYDVSYEFKFHRGIYEVENNPEMIECCQKAANKLWGEGTATIISTTSLGGDNFSEFSRRVPSVYIYAGVHDEKKKEMCSAHSPYFCIDERAIGKIAGVMAEMVFEVNRDTMVYTS